MIYLDYSATTPVLNEVLESYNKTTKLYIGNPNSLHVLGSKANDLLLNATDQICKLLKISNNELLYTSGATMSNNIALLGVALKHPNDSEIIISKLEHPSIYEITNYLKDLGYKIIVVNNTVEGVIDLDDLKEKITKKTILVSICAVNSEVGIRQPLKTIRQIIRKQNKKVVFHSDVTQALGKININFQDIDMASASGHKIFAPKGIGFLYKNKNIKLKPLIHGKTNQSFLLPGTPPLPLIVSLSKALRLAFIDLEKKESYVKKLNEHICKTLIQNEDILINKTKYCIPHILSISIPPIKPETFIHALEKEDIFIGTNTACSKDEKSASLQAIYNDDKRSSYSIRISISYMTTMNDINKFLSNFIKHYSKLKELK